VEETSTLLVVEKVERCNIPPLLSRGCFYVIRTNVLLGEWQRLKKIEYDQENGRNSTRHDEDG
jgi:hypothetical protein